VQRGESVLQVQVQDENPYKVWLDFNNYQSPTVGAERGTITIANQNLTGYGDILSFSYGQSRGIRPIIDASYTLPFTTYDTAVNLRYRKNDFGVVENPFQGLDVQSKSDIYGITLRQPVYRTLNHEIALALSGEYERQQTFLAGEPFSFSPGVNHGESVVTVLRFWPEWIYRAPTQVLAARSRFSLGISAFGSTDNPSGTPDSQFFAWLFQFQWARLLGLRDIQTVFRVDTQLSTVSLLPLEQIAVGGRYSVRGYRENQLVTDQAIITSLEVHVPVFRNKRWADIIELVPFVDFGYAWNKDLPPPSGPDTLASVGLGIRHEVTVEYPFRWRPQYEIFWGIPLRRVTTPGDNLQDYGIHFRFVIVAF
jgi:hemolysin activation/secretion protein